LFDQKFRAAGWTDADFRSYSGWSIRQAVTGIAAGGEVAAVQQVLGAWRLPHRPPGALFDGCMAVIQEARHAQFPGNSGWTWDEKSSRWTARRGTVLVTAAWPRDQMPPVRADQFAVQLTGTDWHGAVTRAMENPGLANLPWGKPVLAAIPERFWTQDWCWGVRYKIVLGGLCSHSDLSQSPACIQPRRESQAEGMEPPCVPFDPDNVRLMLLDGKLSDYA
jgi:hypothetical protein